MLSRSIIRRSVQGANAVLPSISALPARACLSTTVSHTLEPGNVPDELIRSGTHKTSEPARRPTELAASPTPAAPSSSPKLAPPSQGTTPLSDSVRELLPLLQAQKPHYISAHLHARPYLVTAGDVLRLPFLMPDVRPGDVLRLNRATLLGSRDFTLRAPPPVRGTRENPTGGGGSLMRYLDDRLFTCRAIVMGTESEPMRIKEKTKRRQRHVRHAKSKHKYTVLRISELTVHVPEEVEAGSVEVGEPLSAPISE